MKTIKIAPLKNFVVISDVHLQHPKDRNTNTLIAALKSLQEYEAIFLLGDIFDFISISKHYYQKKWSILFDVFKDLQSKGTKIFFLEGNHDFCFEHFPQPFLSSSFERCGDFAVEFYHEHLGNIRVCHGDNIVCPPDYLFFRSLVKSKWLQTIFHYFVPGSFADFIFTRVANLSRKKDKYRKLQNSFLMSCLEKEQKNIEHVQVYIIGHIHLEKDFKLQSGMRFLSGPDWPQRPTLLLIKEDGTLERTTL